jgi:hypothetical protein
MSVRRGRLGVTIHHCGLLPSWLHRGGLGPVDKPVLAPARSERLGRRDNHVATGVTS